jgi:hypothetical protein
MCRAVCGPAGQSIGSKPPIKKNMLALSGPPTARYGLVRHVCAQRIVAQRANILVASPRPRKTRWPCRGRRPRVTGLVRHVCAEGIVAQRANILVASPRPRKTRWPCRGRRPRVTGLVRHVCAEGIVAQRANILVASPRPRKTRWPCRGRRPRINNVLHRCGLPICRPAGALTTLARRCFATDMSPLWGFSGTYVPSGLWPSGPIYW